MAYWWNRTKSVKVRACEGGLDAVDPTADQYRLGTKRTSGDVRYPVANGGRPDMARTAQLGRD